MAVMSRPWRQWRARQSWSWSGSARRRRRWPWLDQAIAEHELPLAPCGYPLVAPSLAWAPGLYVTGGLLSWNWGRWRATFPAHVTPGSGSAPWPARRWSSRGAVNENGTPMWLDFL